MNVKTPKAEQSLQTQEKLIAVARELFTEQGFADTSTEQIVKMAGLTRGALYHQYRDKRDLFRAVYERIERDWAARIGERLGEADRSGRDAWQELRDGAQAFLDLSLAPDIQRIALLEAPAVLGSGLRGDIAPFGLNLIERVLDRAMSQGLIDPQPVAPLAHLLRALITEGAVYIARSETEAAARAEIGAALDGLIAGLRK
jgi:AcrR family transcriptional regulator